MQQRKLPIAGEWIETAETDEIRDPYRGNIVYRVPLAGPGEMERATAGAVEAFEETRALPTHRRVTILEGIVEGIRRRADELAETITRESGKPIRFARGEVERAMLTFTLAADAARGMGGEVMPIDLQPATEGYAFLHRRFPIGPIAAIAPFNFPLNLVAHKVAPAIAAGCPIVLKPPMQAPVTSLILAEICFAAGWPPKALSVVHAVPTVAERLATDPRYRLLSFTGSAKVGWHLKNIAGRKKVVLELGGNAGAVVHEDADLDRVAERCALGAFAAAGQVCIRVQRLLVQRPVYEAFAERFLAATRSLACGDPMDAATVVGPLIDAAASDRVMAWIEEAIDGGARILAGGTRKGSAPGDVGYNLIEPTVLAGTRADMRVEREEIFGPAVTIRPYDTWAEALDRVNEGDFGLQAGVFTRDVGRIWEAFRTLEVGGVVANDYPMLRVDNVPYGGVKASGLGREGPRFAIEDMTEIRSLTLNLNG